MANVGVHFDAMDIAAHEPAHEAADEDMVDPEDVELIAAKIVQVQPNPALLGWRDGCIACAQSISCGSDSGRS